MSDTMFDGEHYEFTCELILLANWMYGKHLEDIPMFDEDLFYFKELYKDIKKGLSIKEIASLRKSAERYELSITDVLKYGDPTDPYCNYELAKGDNLGVQLLIYARRLRDLQDENVDSTKEDRQKLIDKITETNTNIHKVDGIKKATTLASNFIEELEQRQSENNPKYGFKSIDRNTDGLHRGQLVTISARPGQGKSALSLQVALNVMDAGYKVLYIPLEMTEYETVQRMLVQSQTVYDFSEVKNPSEQQIVDIVRYLDRVEKEGLFCIYYGLNDLGSIESVIKEEKPYLIVVDQLTQVDPGVRTKDIREKYIRVTSTLKRIALNENVCILALAQLNRDSTNRNNPGIENLAESDSIGQDSDVVMLMKMEDQEEGMPLRNCELIIDKNRQGEKGKHIQLVFNGSRCTFSETESESRFKQTATSGGW